MNDIGKIDLPPIAAGSVVPLEISKGIYEKEKLEKRLKRDEIRSWIAVGISLLSLCLSVISILS